MADSFHDALESLVKGCPGVQAAGFMDFEGNEIAIVPKGAQERMRTSAAFGGIALRRLGTAEQAAGRGGVRRVSLGGPDGQLMILAVGDTYQLIVTLGEDAGLGVVAKAEETVRLLEAAI
ncbi:MAG: hypothetical protein R3F60_26675 [bacterium]